LNYPHKKTSTTTSSPSFKCAYYCFSVIAGTLAANAVMQIMKWPPHGNRQHYIYDGVPNNWMDL